MLISNLSPSANKAVWVALSIIQPLVYSFSVCQDDDQPFPKQKSKSCRYCMGFHAILIHAGGFVFGLVAQWLAQSAHNTGVESSSLSESTFLRASLKVTIGGVIWANIQVVAAD